MAKKSHRVASRQAAVSKERKRKKRSHVSQRHPMPAGTPAAPSIVATPEPATAPSTVATPKPSTAPSVTRPASTRQAVPRYQYVIADLRKIALIAGAMIIILIVLAFVLG
ncbi:hypothetical protein ES703_02363 [subsurface metagenome]